MGQAGAKRILAGAKLAKDEASEAQIERRRSSVEVRFERGNEVFCQFRASH